MDVGQNFITSVQTSLIMSTMLHREAFKESKLSCLFCEIIDGKLNSTQVYSDDQCVAFRDIHPAAPTHVLVVPRKHIATISELAEEDEQLAGHLLRVGAQVAKDEGIDQSGYRLVFNTNGHAGQTVFHIHLHVLGGRAMEWPPG